MRNGGKKRCPSEAITDTRSVRRPPAGTNRIRSVNMDTRVLRANIQRHAGTLICRDERAHRHRPLAAPAHRSEHVKHQVGRECQASGGTGPHVHCLHCRIDLFEIKAPRSVAPPGSRRDGWGSSCWRARQVLLGVGPSWVRRSYTHLAEQERCPAPARPRVAMRQQSHSRCNTIMYTLP